MQGKKIVIGICSGIAAYKIPLLVRLLVKAGAEVKCVLTPNAYQFVTEETLSVLSNNQVYCQFWNNNKTWESHVELGLWADLLVIAPCTANTLAKMANGICDNLLLAVYFSAKCKTMFAPAMDLDMMLHQTTTYNIKKLESFGNIFIEPASGALASGLEGKGRLPEPQELFEKISSFFLQQMSLKGKKVLVNAGPTYENIDPVRFIGNYSSGKMGYAIARSFANCGADVVLISGPTAIKKPNLVEFIPIQSANEMLSECNKYFNKCHYTVLSAAIADYKPVLTATEKIKKSSEHLTIELEKNPDILSALGKQKQTWQTLVGFALETNNGEENAREKLIKKNADAIILNYKNEQNKAFGSDDNEVSIISHTGQKKLAKMNKNKLADILVEEIIKLKSE